MPNNPTLTLLRLTTAIALSMVALGATASEATSTCPQTCTPTPPHQTCARKAPPCDIDQMHKPAPHPKQKRPAKNREFVLQGTQ